MISAKVPSLKPEHVALIASKFSGARLEPLQPIGAALYGFSLKQSSPDESALQALEQVMAQRGFVVFKDQHDLSPEELVKSCCWFGGKQVHSTHAVHPATPNYNRDIFRVSNDSSHGILGVGPQWHNDGSFVAGTFSHAAYHIIRVPEHGGGTEFAHQGAAYDALPKETQEYWERLVSVNSNSGVLHPVVHTHPISKRKSVWLHLGMTGAVIERTPSGSLRLLSPEELKKLCRDYQELMQNGLKDGYTIKYEYENGDCIIIDNLAVGHRAAPEAHRPPEEQGLRIMHRVTVKAVEDFAPPFGLPQFMDISGPNPFENSDGGVWQGGGLGFRWDENIHMQN